MTENDSSVLAMEKRNPDRTKIWNVLIEDQQKKFIKKMDISLILNNYIAHK
jgi:hypothetical protein